MSGWSIVLFDSATEKPVLHNSPTLNGNYFHLSYNFGCFDGWKPDRSCDRTLAKEQIPKIEETLEVYKALGYIPELKEGETRYRITENVYLYLNV